MNLPNKITLTRICLIPLFVLFFFLEVPGFFPYNYLVALLVFCAAAFTDALDGHIARSRGLVTNLGKFLDPIADKVLVSTAFICLVASQYSLFDALFGYGVMIMAAIFVALIMARELIITGFRGIAVERGIVLAADKLGKIKAVAQDVTIAVALFAMTLYQAYDAAFGFGVIAVICLTASTILTLVSGFNYIWQNRSVLKEGASEEAEASEEESFKPFDEEI